MRAPVPWHRLEDYPDPFEWSLRGDELWVLPLGVGGRILEWWRAVGAWRFSRAIDRLARCVAEGHLDAWEPARRATLRWLLEANLAQVVCPDALRHRNRSVLVNLEPSDSGPERRVRAAIGVFDKAIRVRFPVRPREGDLTPLLRRSDPDGVVGALFLDLLPHCGPSPEDHSRLADLVVRASAAMTACGLGSYLSSHDFAERLWRKAAQPGGGLLPCHVLHHGTCEWVLDRVLRLGMTCADRGYSTGLATRGREHAERLTAHSWVAIRRPETEDGFFYCHRAALALSYASRSPEWLMWMRRADDREALADLTVAALAHSVDTASSLGLVQWIDASPGNWHRIPPAVSGFNPVLSRLAERLATNDFPHADEIDSFQACDAWYPLDVVAFRVPRSWKPQDPFAGWAPRSTLDQIFASL